MSTDATTETGGSTKKAPDLDLDTSNKFLVGSNGAHLVFLKPLPQKITRGDALLLAAWLVAIASEEDDEADFRRVLEAVQST
jgi:hypothetical protein